MPIIRRLVTGHLNGQRGRKHVEVTDFPWTSVLFMSTDQFLRSSSGCSDQEIISFKREVNGVYPGARGDEVQIETEDIQE